MCDGGYRGSLGEATYFVWAARLLDLPNCPCGADCIADAEPGQAVRFRQRAHDDHAVVRHGEVDAARVCVIRIRLIDHKHALHTSGELLDGSTTVLRPCRVIGIAD